MLFPTSFPLLLLASKKMIEKIEERLQAKWPHVYSVAEIAEICQGWEILGIGGERLALAINEEEVWKVAWRESGLVASETEYLLWRRSSASLRALLCPSLEITPGGSLRQRRVQPVSYDALGNQGPKIIKTMAQYGITDVAINCGVLEERVVVYDYSTISPKLRDSLYREF